MPEMANSVLQGIPEDLPQLDSERWVCILTSEGMTQWPGTCTRRNCTRAIAADDVCMTHWCADWSNGKRRDRGIQ